MVGTDSDTFLEIVEELGAMTDLPQIDHYPCDVCGWAMCGKKPLIGDDFHYDCDHPLCQICDMMYRLVINHNEDMTCLHCGGDPWRDSYED